MLTTINVATQQQAESIDITAQVRQAVQPDDGPRQRRVDSQVPRG